MHRGIIEHDNRRSRQALAELIQIIAAPCGVDALLRRTEETEVVPREQGEAVYHFAARAQRRHFLILARPAMRNAR